MKRRTFLTCLAGITTALVLSGCGFQLRGYGAPELSIERLALSAADTGPRAQLTQRVSQTLESAGVTLDDSAPLRLNLGEAKTTERELSFGDAGNQEREVTLTLPFSVQRVSDGAYLLDQQQVESRGTFYTSSDQLLSRDDQREELLEDLRDDAARRLLERLRNLDTQSVSTH
ncbi:LPS-assembly lipoprotein LptE [Phytohalomonas tamaricis]|uniref:LPS-assembly lipoprotein LptE n=1 Tax=Phytohalomonas tamaricis TaxID=2081032 RepID=UPI00131A1A2C|nr:LPS assembly lipoprotein LptE [Phytohalomonas tamaricis]